MRLSLKAIDVPRHVLLIQFARIACAIDDIVDVAVLRDGYATILPLSVREQVPPFLEQIIIQPHCLPIDVHLLTNYNIMF